MSRPLFSVKHVSTEALLPKNLTIGHAYFIADEKEIVIDHGDGRGPIRYGSKPGPQGMPGEPIPSLQGQIDELALASLATTQNIHWLNKTTKKMLSISTILFRKILTCSNHRMRTTLTLYYPSSSPSIKSSQIMTPSSTFSLTLSPISILIRMEARRATALMIRQKASSQLMTVPATKSHRLILRATLESLS